MKLARLSALAGALVVTVTALAGVAEAGHTPEPTITRGLFTQGLLPSSTGLDAPLGDSRAASAGATEATASATAGPPLRVYVVVVDGLLPTQVGLRTPTLNELKNQGTWYEQARAVAPAETLPNHAAMATGVVPQKSGIVANQFFRGKTVREYMQYPEFFEADTITTRLERAYRGDISTATILSKEYLYGLFRGEHDGPGDALPQREADFHWDPRSQSAYIGNPSFHALDVATMDALLGWVRTQEGSAQPQFGFVNLGDVDRAGHADEQGVGTAAADRGASGEDELSEQHSAPFQQAAIEDTDTQIGRLVTELKNTGAWDESVLIVLSDHGMDWGPQNQGVKTVDALAAAGYVRGSDLTSGTTTDFAVVGGGGSELIYPYVERDIEPMARILCSVEGVAVVATRRPVPGLDSAGCRGRTLAELGLDHRYSPDIELFLEPGWRSSPGDPTVNPLPGNHGHTITQHSALLVSGGHPAVDPAGPIGGTRVYARNDVAPPTGPGVLSVAPTVAGLFGIGAPEGGYDAAPLAEAFEPGAVDLSTIDPARVPAPGGAEDGDAPAGGTGGATDPLVTVGVDVVEASMTHATYSLYVANRGSAPAEGVVLTNDVPANTAFAGSDRTPLDPGACGRGAAVGTRCRWAIGDLAPGSSGRVEVTYELAQTGATYTVGNRASAQIGGAAPAGTDPAFTHSLLDRTVLAVEDAHVDDAAPANTNYGSCARLDVGRGNTVTAFLDADGAFPNEYGSTSTASIGTLWAAELQATTESAGGAEPVEVSAHRISSHEWSEGTSGCTGATGQNRVARTPGPADAEPISDPGAVATRPVAAAEQVVTWDVAAAVDTRAERISFNGFELRLAEGAGGPVPERTVAFRSRQAAAAAARPRFVTVTTRNLPIGCVDTDPETGTARSDEVQRIRAYTTYGAAERVTNAAGDDACNGSPAPAASVGWELDDDSPDAYISTLAGEPTERETGRSGDAAPNTGSTLTGPNGRTFIDVRLGEPYAQEGSSGTSRTAAIVLVDHDAYNAPPAFTGQGVCEPGAINGDQSCADDGESRLEDDVATTWEAAEPPSISIAGVALAEGNSGTSNADFTLSLSRAGGVPVDVDYATADGTATAPSDYEPQGPATVTFAPGETQKTVSVPVTGDGTVEPDETFTLALSEPVNAELATASATGTIVDDDSRELTPDPFDPPPGGGGGGGGDTFDASPDRERAPDSSEERTPDSSELPTPEVRTARCNGLEATIIGSAGSDPERLLSGSSRRDVIAALGGDDRANGRARADALCGGRGGDSLRGGTGDDHVRGGAGPDRLFGGRHNDTLDGGRGNDHIFSVARSKDRIVCGRGFDVVRAGSADEVARSCETVRRFR